MIPQNLHWAFEENHRVHTLAGTGKTKRHRLADLVLPSGKISTGYPGDNYINNPNQFQPQVSPGIYPVFINVVRNKGAASTFAFLGVSFTNADMVSWEHAGKFFTDSGDGCIFDVSVTDLLRKKRSQMSREEWGRRKMAALDIGDGNLILDETSGANALIFRTNDWSYNCFTGHDRQGQITCLVIDGRVQQSHENLFDSLLAMLSPKVKR
jgi:hypothetical protein